MSVISSRRSVSSIQFVATARELVKFTTQKCLKFPKRLTFFITTDIVKTSQEIYKDVLHIKNIYSVGCIPNRLELIEKCLSRLEYMSSMLDIAIIYSPEIKPSAFDRWAEIINYETILLKGLKTKDKERLKNNLGSI